MVSMSASTHHFIASIISEPRDWLFGAVMLGLLVPFFTYMTPLYFQLARAIELLKDARNQTELFALALEG